MHTDAPSGSVAVVVEAIRHPFAASTEELRAAIELAQHDVRDDQLTLRLPCDHEQPLPSHRLEGLSGPVKDEFSPQWGESVIPSLSLGAGSAFDLLRTISAASNGHFETGASLRWVARVGELLEEMLIESRFIPTVYQHPQGLLEGAWMPYLDDVATQDRLRTIIRDAPPSACAAVDGFGHQGWPMLRDLLACMTDAFVRQVLIESDFVESIDGRSAEDDNHVPLLQMLLSDARETRLRDGRAADVFRDVRRWLGRLGETPTDAPLRFALRVNEPLIAPDSHISPGSDPQWMVSLQVVNSQGGAEIDAETLWEDHNAVVLPLPIDEAQEFVLREIARVRTIWPTIAGALDKTSVSAIALSTREAYEFLSETAPILEEAGVTVAVPSWWGNPSGRLGARLRLSPKEERDPQGGPGIPSNSGGASSSFSGRLGLQTLVHFTWELSVGEKALTLGEFQEIAKSGAPLVPVAGQWVEVRAEDMAAAEDLLSGGADGEMTILEAMHRAYGVQANGPRLNVLGLDAAGWIRELLDATSGDMALEMLEQPGALNGELRPYQRAGLSWLVFLDQHGLGACLADDMGLGKTIQLIALLLQEREHSSAGGSRPRPTLVIAPMSVISNWQREVNRFAAELTVHIHHGIDRPTGEAFADIARATDVVLTTYGLTSRDVDTLSLVHWGRVVLDEAQFVKNTPTKQAQAIRTLRTDRRVALTGTPIENRLIELWSIMDFLNPGYLGSQRDFRQRFALPIEKYRDQDRSSALRALIRPFVLRRLKTDPDVVPDLPDIVRTKVYAALTGEQARLYKEVLSTMIENVDHAQGIQRRGLVLAGIVKLKQICNHPANLPEATQIDSGGVDDDARSSSSRSGKMKALLPILDEIIAGDGQALIFTQYRRMGHLLERIVEHDLNVSVQFMHGGTPRAKRQQMIDRFQDSSLHTPVFILSLRAGGVGLNLTAANHVVHYDRWWNPAVESQATDRAFRIGQKRTVHVHTLICSGTLEERIDEMLEQKMDLADRIVGSGDSWLTEMSTGQLRELLELRDSAMEGEGDD